MSAVPPSSNDVDRPYPPIAWLTTGALGVIVVGGILMASYAPRRAPLGIATALLIVGAVLLVSAAVALSRVATFSWTTFRKVFKWALLAYVLEAGMIEFAFLRDHTRGSSLAIVSGLLVIFATSVPTTIAFTVARFAELD
ncbi:MAG: hypothetical protein ACRDV0_09890 [Acidimicrobiales bacterium]